MQRRRLCHLRNRRDKVQLNIPEETLGRKGCRAGRKDGKTTWSLEVMTSEASDARLYRD